MWGIGSQDLGANLALFAEQMGLTLPVLIDTDDSVHDQYNPGSSVTSSVYPQNWIIGVDGKLAYVSTTYSPNKMATLIEAELDKMSSR